MTVKTPDEMYKDIKKLSWDERLRLITQILQDMILEKSAKPSDKRLRSLHGIWQGFSISEHDITQARKAVWERFNN